MRLFFTIIFCICCHGLLAQSRMAFTRLRAGDGSGLASNAVYSIYQDKKGFIWAGTANGLQRFDGSKFIQVSSGQQDKGKLPHVGISQIIDAGNGKLMLAMASIREFGLFETSTFAYQKISLQTTRPIPPRAEFHIWKTADGSIFLNVLRYGILHYDQKLNAFVDDHFFSLPANWLPSQSAIYEDTVKKQIWIGCDSGLAVYHIPTKETWYPGNNPRRLGLLNNDRLHQMINSIYMDKQRRTWVFGWKTEGQFTYCFDSSGQNFLEKDTVGIHTGPVGYTTYNHLYETTKGGFWLYGSGILFNWDNQLQRFNFNKSDFRNDEVSINYETVYQVTEDRDGSVWIATDRGLYIVSTSSDNLAVVNLIFDSNKESVSITDILELPNGNLWFTTWGSGLRVVDKYFNPVSNDLYKQAPPASWSSAQKGAAKLTWSLCRQSSTGNIWVGCNEGVLLVHDPVKKTTAYHQPGVFNNSTIRFITEDGQGQLWFGTQSGRLIKYANQVFTTVQEIGTIIYKVFIDRQGDIWLATHEKGLYHLDPSGTKILQHYSTERKQGPLFSNTGYDIEQLNDSIIIYGAGALNFINKKSGHVKILTYDEGLPSNNVIRLRMDLTGFLWIVTTNGLCRYNPNNNRITAYGKKDGIILAEQASVADYTCANGKLVFGGSNAVVMFHPSVFSNTTIPPDVSITDFKLLDRYFPVDSLMSVPVIKLRHNQNSFSIYFSALSYMQLDKLTYYYQMEGIDKTWKKADRGFSENYSLLPPGKYTFKVYCENLEGMRSKNTTEISLHIKPPFWQTWWFRFSILFLLALIIFDLHHLRVKRLLAVEKLRNKVARDLHDDMGSTLSSINILSAMAKSKINTDQPKASEYLGKITDNSQRMMEAMDDIVWSIKPSNDSMQKITARMREFATSALEPKEMELKFDVDENVYDEKLNMETRRDFFLVFKEAVNNAAKYSKATRVDIQIKVQGKKLLLLVKDNGIGFDVANAADGNGLGNMQKRAESMKGTVKIQSSEKEGTTVIVMLPIS